jgi:hypothetical protein
MAAWALDVSDGSGVRDCHSLSSLRADAVMALSQSEHPGLQIHEKTRLGTARLPFLLGVKMGSSCSLELEPFLVAQLPGGRGTPGAAQLVWIPEPLEKY